MRDIENVKKFAKILIFAFLCSEMQPNVTLVGSGEGKPKPYVNLKNGTTEATMEYTKYQASIRLIAQDKTFGEGHICSGALIAPSVVVTAAQCIFNYSKNTFRHPAEIKVVLGALNRFERTTHTMSLGATHFYWPQTFQPQTLRDNIALIMLERDIPEQNANVQPIEIVQQVDTRAAHDAPASEYEVTSWGITNKGAFISQLMSLNATSRQGDQMCGAQQVGNICVEFPATHAYQIFPTDAGAPLLQNNKLLGLRAHAVDEIFVDSSAVFTNVALHKKWIVAQIGSGNNQNSSLLGTFGFLLFTIFTLKSMNYVKF